MTQQSKLQIVQNLPTPAELAQAIPAIQTLNRKIKELEKKVSALELDAERRQQKTRRFKFF